MLPIQNLLRRKVRTLFALLGIAVGISAVVSIVSTAKGLRSQFYRIADQFGCDVIVQQKGVPSPLFSAMEKGDAEAVRKLPHVKGVSPLTVHFVRRKDPAHPQPVAMLGMEPGSEILARYEIVRGRTLEKDDKNAIILGLLGAEQLGVDVGGALETEDAVGKYTVVGVFRPPVSGVEMLSGQAVVSSDYLRKKFHRPPSMLVAHLRTTDEMKKLEPMDARVLDASIAEIRSALAMDAEIGERLEAKPFKSYIDSFKQAEIVDKFAWALSFLAALVGGIGIANTMLMSVFERTREIGLLRSVGWSKVQVASLIVQEGVVLSLIGGALGVPLGYVEVFAATRVVEGGWIPVSIEPVVAAEAVMLAVAIGVVGSLYPGLRAANLDPTEALRYE